MDKRAGERVPILGELQAEIMVFQPMLVAEVGRDGASVDTRFSLHIDSLHELRLTLGDRSVIVKGRVAHSQISDVDQEIVTYRSGIEFVDVSEPAAAVIADFVAALKDGRSGV
jgi:hypothetical protein